GRCARGVGCAGFGALSGSTRGLVAGMGALGAGSWDDLHLGPYAGAVCAGTAGAARGFAGERAFGAGAEDAGRCAASSDDVERGCAVLFGRRAYAGAAGSRDRGGAEYADSY